MVRHGGSASTSCGPTFAWGFPPRAMMGGSNRWLAIGCGPPSQVRILLGSLKTCRPRRGDDEGMIDTPPLRFIPLAASVELCLDLPRVIFSLHDSFSAGRGS